MDGFADHSQRCFQIAVGGFEGVGVNGERRAEDNERGTVLRALDGLLETESTDGLHGDFDGVDDFAELVERAGRAVASGGDAGTGADVLEATIAEVAQEPVRRRRMGQRAAVVRYARARATGPGVVGGRASHSVGTRSSPIRSVGVAGDRS